jgi:hypothetical protein
MDRGGINFPNIGNALLPLIQMDRQAERDELDGGDYLDFLMPSRDGVYNALGAPADSAAWFLRRLGLPSTRAPAFGTGWWRDAIESPNTTRPDLLNALRRWRP